MAEDVHRRAKESDTVCAVTYPLPKEELERHGNRKSHSLLPFTQIVLFTPCETRKMKAQ